MRLLCIVNVQHGSFRNIKIIEVQRSGRSAGITFTEVNIETDQEAADFVVTANGGNQTVPTVLFPDGTSATNPSLKDVQRRLA